MSKDSLGCSNVKQKIVYEITAILDFTHKQCMNVHLSTLYYTRNKEKAEGIKRNIYV